MPPSSDIILVGAGRSPHTKFKRRINGFPQRNFYIGTLHIRTGLRVPVDLEFIKKWFNEIVKRIEAGTLLVEYKNDSFVDPEELKTLAFGGDAEKEAYEEEARNKIEAKAEEQKMASEELREKQVEERRLSALGTAVPGAEDDEALPREEGGTEDGTVPDAVRLDDNLEGSHAQKVLSPRDVADARVAELAAAGKYDASGNVSDGGEPELTPATPSAERAASPDFRPLPEGWQKAPKPELLALCEERGIDVSDMPSNKELRHRLDAYIARA